MTDLPRPAPPFTHTVGGFGVWLNHRTLAEVEADRRAALLEAHKRVTGRNVVPPSVRIR